MSGRYLNGSASRLSKLHRTRPNAGDRPQASSIPDDRVQPPSGFGPFTEDGDFDQFETSQCDVDGEIFEVFVLFAVFKILSNLDIAVSPP